jgi:putative transposase
VLGVSESGFYERRRRAPSARTIRHAWLTDRSPRSISTPTSPTERYGSTPTSRWSWHHGRTQRGMALLMRRAGLHGLPGARRRRFSHQTHGDRSRRASVHAERAKPTVGDRHHRAPHPRRQGLLLGRARRVLTPCGGLVDRCCSQATLVTNALGMAIENRRPSPGALMSSPMKSAAFDPKRHRGLLRSRAAKVTPGRRYVLRSADRPLHRDVPRPSPGARSVGQRVSTGHPRLAE